MHTKTHNARLAVIVSLALLLPLAGCQSTGANTAGPEAAPVGSAGAGSGPTEITFATDPDMLLALLRQAGPSITRGGVVLMNGSGQTVVPAQDFRGLDTAAFARQLAQAGNLALGHGAAYDFLYPAGYEGLAAAQYPVHAHFQGVRASVDFGDGTKLYNALAIVSALLKTSLVADNIIAENPTGEVVLRGAPLDSVVEALLRSARIPAEAVRVESAEDYIFLRAASNTTPPEVLLDEAALSPVERAALEARVNLTLPESAERPGAAVFVNSAVQLGDILPSLGRQLGVPVQAPGLESLPVNYTVLHNISIRTALNLLIRQWPTPDFGYVYKDGIITLRGR